MLWVLLVVPPLLSFLLEPLFLRYEGGHVAGTLAAIFVFTLSVGTVLHFSVNAVSRALPAGWSMRARVGPVALATIASVLASSWVVMPLLARLCPGVPGSEWTVVLRGLAVGAIYVTLGLVVGALFERLVQARLRTEEMARQRAEVRAASLVSRMRPHFLFNALNTASGLIHREPDRAEEMLARVASLLRASLEAPDHAFVRLEDELALVRDYLEVESVRFGERLRIEYAVHPGLEREFVIPWLLQPLVENAVVHGIAPRTSGGTVRISASREGEAMRLSVEDDGVGLGESPRVGTKKTIASLPERLLLVYGDAASFSLTRRDAGGTRATMLIPRREK